MSINKNPGPILTSKIVGSADLTPPKWRAKRGLKIIEQENPPDIDPEAITDVRIESKVIQSRTDERKKTDTELTGALTDKLIDQRRLPNGQIATRTQTYPVEGTDLEVTDETIEAAQDVTGDGHMEQYIIEADLPGPTIYSTRLDPDDVIVFVAKTRKLIADITEGDAVNAGIWTKTTREGETENVATEVVESREIPGNDIVKTSIDQNGDILVETRRMVEASTIATTNSIITGVWTKTFEEPITALVAWQVTQVRDTQNELDSFEVLIPDLIPPEFRGVAPITTTEQTLIGDASLPTLATGDISRKEQQLDAFSYRLTISGRADVTIPVTIHNKETNEAKQVVDVAMTLELASTPPTTPTALIDVEFRNLGNGLAVETVRTIEEVFPRDSYTKSVLNLIPEKLRAAIPLFESTIDEPGSPDTTPNLLTGELSRTETRLTDFTKRTHIVSLGAITVPVSVTDYETDRDKQLVTVVYTLIDHGTSVASITALQDVIVDDLGNGYDVETVRSVPEVFPANTNGISIIDLIPPAMRAAVPMYESDELLAGTADTTPSLATGELSHSETQVNEFVKRVRITSLGSISPPITITEIQTNADKQVVTILHTLRLTGDGTATPTALVDVDRIDLGNGYEVETTKTIASVFPANTYTKSIENLIPPNLRAGIPITQSDVSSAGTASTNPTLLTGELSRSETQVNEYVKRIRITSLGSISVPVSVTNTETDKDKQVVTVVESLITHGTSAVAPTALRDVEVRDLGNGYDVQITRTVPTVFPANSNGISILDLIPPSLRAAVPMYESDVLSSGTADTTPSLATGELSRIESQVNEFVKRVRTTSLGSISPPVSVTELQTNNDKQVVTVVHTLRLTGTGTAVPTALIDVETVELGNGYDVETTKTIAAVFPAYTYSKSIVDLIPASLRAAVPMYESDVTSAGTADTTPDLLTGELSRSETQVTEFTKRVKVTSLGSVSVPVTITNEELTEKFGGGVAERVITLNTSAGTIDEGLTIIDSKVVELGNGYFIKDTLQLVAAAWPTLLSDLFDPEMQVRYEKEVQIVDAGTAADTGAGFVETVEDIDYKRARRTKIIKDFSAHNSSDNALISYRYHPFQFPGTLDYKRLITYDHREGYRKASALLTKHTVRTWWLESATPPTVELGGDVEVFEIITDTVNAPIFAEGNTTLAITFPDVLHDDITNTLGAFYPATFPSFTDYYTGVPSGTTGFFGFAVSTGTNGTGYDLGASCTIGGYSFIVSGIGAAGELTFPVPDPLAPSGVSYLSVTNLGPFSVSGGGGSGAIYTLYEVEYDIPVPGSAWVGTEKPIAATVTQTEIPSLWKVVTESVVMR